MSYLSRFFGGVVSFLDSMARARAAAELAREGYIKEANQLINGEPIA